MQDLQNELQAEFQKRLLPVIEEVAKEKGLHAVFSVADSGAAYVHPGLNLSEESSRGSTARSNLEIWKFGNLEIGVTWKSELKISTFPHFQISK